MRLLRCAIAVGLGSLAAPALADDCAGQAKAALASRLKALPLRETTDSDGDGEHIRVVLEFETLHRFHSLIAGAAGTLAIELLILDGKGWSKEHGRWAPFAAAAATTESTAGDEAALADQLTDGATVTCLGPTAANGRPAVGFALEMDGDPSSGNPYEHMQLLVEAQSGLPAEIDMTGPGEAGTATTRETFDYDKAIKLTPP